MAEWNQCYYCGKPLSRNRITLDHVNPKSAGGGKMVTSCALCNSYKADRDIEAFREFLHIEHFYGETMGWKPW